MKKILSILLCLLILTSIFGCKDDSGDEEKHYITVTEYALKADMTLAGMADAISKQFGFSMTMELSDKTLESLYYITPSAVEEYAGIFSISMSSADNVLIVKPQSGKVAVVKYGFDQRKQDVMDTFTGYLEDSYKQAENAVTIERDGYYFFVCADAEASAIEEFIDTFFDITEKQVEVAGPSDENQDLTDPDTVDDSVTPDNQDAQTDGNTDQETAQ